MPEAFARLLRTVGLRIGLGQDGFGDVTPEALAAQMARPENASMRRSNAREVGDDDLMTFARSVLSQARAP